MFYKLLGKAAWKGGKILIRERYSSGTATKGLLAGGLALAAFGVLFAVLKRG